MAADPRLDLGAFWWDYRDQQVSSLRPGLVAPLAGNAGGLRKLRRQMDEIDRFESSTGNLIALRSDGTSWEVANCASGGELVWTETSVNGDHPFTEYEA